MRLNFLLPVENYRLTTKLTVEEVIAKIQNNTETKGNSRFSTRNKFSPESKPYEGNIADNSFAISRIINYRNSFVPIISGTILSVDGRTEIKINMRLQKFVLVFILVFMGVIGIAFIVQIIFFINNSPNKSYFSLLNTFISLIFCGLLTGFAFKKENKISKQFLAKLFEAKQVDN